MVELASRLVSNPRYTTSEKTEWVLHSIACRAAIKAGDKSHAAQLLRLAEDLLDGRVPPFCPQMCIRDSRNRRRRARPSYL